MFTRVAAHAIAATHTPETLRGTPMLAAERPTDGATERQAIIRDTEP
jgi:hypothetical protein